MAFVVQRKTLLVDSFAINAKYEMKYVYTEMRNFVDF